MAFANWEADYEDPDDFLNLLLESGTPFPTFKDPTVARRLAPCRRAQRDQSLPGVCKARHRTREDSCTFVAFGSPYGHSLFSARIGCQIFSPVYGADIAALCLRRKG